jgi:hypothetical protein
VFGLILVGFANQGLFNDASAYLAGKGTVTPIATPAAGTSARGGAASSAAAAAATVHTEPTTISKNVINSLVKSAEAKAVTTSPCTAPCVDLETVKLGRSIFATNGLRPLADVSPFKVIGGHVSLTSPKNIKLVAAAITTRGIEHAVVVDLTKVRDIKAGESLFRTDLGEVISGTNPFTKSHDTVSDFTSLLLWNNSNSPVSFSEDSQVAMDVVYQ